MFLFTAGDLNTIKSNRLKIAGLSYASNKTISVRPRSVIMTAQNQTSEQISSSKTYKFTP
jgi:hypothetical protein